MVAARLWLDRQDPLEVWGQLRNRRMRFRRSAHAHLISCFSISKRTRAQTDYARPRAQAVRVRCTSCTGHSHLIASLRSLALSRSLAWLLRPVTAKRSIQSPSYDSCNGFGSPCGVHHTHRLPSRRVRMRPPARLLCQYIRTDTDLPSTAPPRPQSPAALDVLDAGQIASEQAQDQHHARGHRRAVAEPAGEQLAHPWSRRLHTACVPIAAPIASATGPLRRAAGSASGGMELRTTRSHA